MDPRSTQAQYPRIDKAYQAKNSLDFDSFKSKIYADRILTWRQHFAKWNAMILTGLLMGTAAFFMDILEDTLNSIRSGITDTLVSQSYGQSIGLGYAFYVAFGAICILISTLLTIYVAPAANGSGVAEIIAMLNGINYPGIIDPTTMVVKALGVVLAVVGGLCIGQEGPMCHIGAILGVLVLYLPIKAFEEFQNDHERRIFMAAGSAAGVSAAFGAPIGGTLFAYEISTPNTFWTFSMLWKVFLCAGVSTFSLAVLDSLSTGAPVTLGVAGSLKFGTLIQTDIPIQELIAAVGIGAISGCLGALFVTITVRLGMLRKKYINTNWKKIVEVLLFGIATNTAFFYGPALFDQCIPTPSTEILDDTFYQYTCEDGKFNPLATLFFNTEGGVIHSLLSVNLKISIGEILYFFCIWYFFTVTTYGVWVPAGLFLPGMIIGCALGIIWGDTVESFLPGDHVTQSKQIMGAAAMLAGYTRFTYSLAVIMLETTNSINLFIPIICTISVAFQTGQAFNKSLYERALRSKQLPVLREEVPYECSNIRAGQIMSKHLECVEGVGKIRDIISLLRDSTHGAFPVVNINGNVVGMIPRNFLFVLIENLMFYKTDDHDVRQGKVSFHYTAISSFYQKRDLVKDGPVDLARFGNNQEDELPEMQSRDSMTSNAQQNSKSQQILTANIDGIIQGQSLEQPFLNQNLDNSKSQDLSYQEPLKINDSQPRRAESKVDVEIEFDDQQQVDQEDPVRQTQLEQEIEGLKESVLSNTTAVQNERTTKLNMMHLSAFQKRARFERSKSQERDYEAVELFTSDLDVEAVPLCNEVLPWEAFNSPFYSQDRKYDEIKHICEDNIQERIDLRPYMIECPFQVFTTDKLQKVLNIFRHMHLRHLLVTNPTDGKYVGIITRQDIFAYMSL